MRIGRGKVAKLAYGPSVAAPSAHEEPFGDTVLFLVEVRKEADQVLCIRVVFGQVVKFRHSRRITLGGPQVCILRLSVASSPSLVTSLVELCK